MTDLSPYFSKDRKTTLLSADECASVFGVSVKTIRRWMDSQGNALYTEDVSERRAGGGGGQITRYIDPATLGKPLPVNVHRSELRWTPAVDIESCGGHQAATPISTPEKAIAQDLTVKLHEAELMSTAADLRWTSEPSELALPSQQGAVAVGDLESAQKLHGLIVPVLKHKPGTKARRTALEQIASDKGVSSRTVRRWVAAFEEAGLVGLSRISGTLPRADKGTHRLPLALVQIIQSTWVSNPRTISARKVHQIIVNAVPELAAVPRKNGRVIQVSVATVQAIRDEMMADPHLRLLFMDADAIKEYTRTWSGQVLAAHANDMWQMDMTRCDIMVYDPEADLIYRPRVQAVIDVYSGCIMGISFSRKEDQDQADLVLARSLMRKPDPVGKHWPMFGIARRLYIDNGKTYRSEHFHRIVGGLGMEIIHSRPRVSHTRGKIERFFGSLHWLEKSLVGYCGENAADRSNEELKRLEANTLAWARDGKSMPDGQRLLTLSEYQERVLKWLVVEYHATVEHGLTRQQHWLQTAPRNTLVDLDPRELMVLFGRWKEKVVSGNGEVTIDKVKWTTPNGKLAQFQGQRVQVMTEAFAMGDPRRWVIWKDRHGRTQILGEIVQAPTAADSLEAADQRRANRQATKEQIDVVQGIRPELFNPATTIDAHLNRQMQEVVVQPVLPAPRGRLAAVNPDQPQKPDLGDFGRSFLKPADDLDALLRQIREENE